MERALSGGEPGGLILPDVLHLGRTEGICTLSARIEALRSETGPARDGVELGQLGFLGCGAACNRCSADKAHDDHGGCGPAEGPSGRTRCEEFRPPRVLDVFFGEGGEEERRGRHPDPVGVGQIAVDDARQEDDQRPVPEVEGIGDIAEELDRPRGQGVVGGPHREPGAETDHEHRPEYWNDRGVPGEIRSLVVTEGSQRDHREPSRLGQAGQRSRTSPPGGQGGCGRRNKGARSKFPHTSGGHEIRFAAARVGEIDRESQRRGTNDDEAQDKVPAPVTGESPGRNENAQEEDGPHEVELFLDGERPVVLNR